MPLFPKDNEASNEPATQETPQPIQKEIVIPEQNTSAVYSVPDTANVHKTSLEGTPRRVTYYYQVLGEDDYPRRLDFGLHPSLQDYIKVQDMIILDTSEADGSKDENQIWELRGEANVYPGIPVNQWDMFVAQLADGRMGVFTVYENPEETSIYAYAGYRIQYELVSILNDAYQIELNKKTSNTIYFDEDNPTCPGKNLSTVQENVSAKEIMPLIITMLYDEFYDKDTRTMIVEKSMQTWYDTAAVEFLCAILPAKMRGRRPRPQVYAVPSIEYIEQIRTIWDVLLRDDESLLSVVTDKVGDVGIANYHSNFIMTGISLLDISGVIHPGDGTSLSGDVNMDSTYSYVFSEAFYKNETTAMTPWEIKVMGVLCGEQYTVSDVKDEIENLKNLKPIERFHRLLTMVWLLIKKL